MKTLIKGIFIKKQQIFTIIIFTAFFTAMLPADNITAKSAGEVTVVISLPTIQCGTCENTIGDALDKVKGINAYEINLEGKKVTVTYDDKITDLSGIEQAISKSGYDANNIKADKKAYNKLHSCCKKPEDR